MNIKVIYVSGEATSAFFAEHKEVFLNKNTLQLKIREVRQKMMGYQHNAGDLAQSAALHEAPNGGTKTTSHHPPFSNHHSQSSALLDNKLLAIGETKPGRSQPEHLS